MSSSPKLVLASGSPRRRELLDGLGLIFEVRPVEVDETAQEGEDPATYVERLARVKATAEARAGEVVLAADTTVVLEGELLGKPTDPEEACTMLRRLAGREHTVVTGVAAYDAAAQRLEAGSARTRVRIAALSEAEIDWYVATGEPLDKAGAYAIQGLGALFVEAVEGNYTNVVGLPLPLTYRLVARSGYDLRDFRRPLRAPSAEPVNG